MEIVSQCSAGQTSTTPIQRMKHPDHCCPPLRTPFKNDLCHISPGDHAEETNHATDKSLLLEADASLLDDHYEEFSHQMGNQLGLGQLSMQEKVQVDLLKTLKKL